MKKVSKILLTVFAIGVLLSVLGGALSFVGYIAAMVIGGDTAVAICAFIYKQYFPFVIRMCSVSVGVGLIGMYLEKQKALTFVAEKTKKKK